MSVIKKKLNLMTIFLIVLGLNSCLNSSNSKLLGKWSLNGEEILEFTNSKIISMGSIEQDYKIENGSIKINAMFFGQSTTQILCESFEFIDDDTLKLKGGLLEMMIKTKIKNYDGTILKRVK